MHAAIRQGQLKPGVLAEVEQRVKAGAFPILHSIKGFRSYQWVLGEDNAVTIITLFDDAAAAEESNRLLMPWIREHLAPYLESMPTAITGRVVLQETA